MGLLEVRIRANASKGARKELLGFGDELRQEVVALQNGALMVYKNTKQLRKTR